MTVSAITCYQCRLCMGNDNFQLNIFRDDFHHKQILLKIRTCLPIKIESGDGLPSTICYKCLAQLDNSFDLWKKSCDTEAILKYNIANGGVHPFINNKIRNHGVLNQFENGFQASEPDILEHVGSGESFLDSLDENVWNSANIRSSWQKQSNHNNHHIRHNEKYDMLSDQDLSEVDEISQRKAWSSTKPHLRNEKHAGDKKIEIADRSPRIQSGQGNVLRSHENDWRDKNDTCDVSKIGETNATNRYIHKNLFANQLTNEHGRLTKSKSNNGPVEDLLINQSQKEVIRRRLLLPWQKSYGDNYGKKLKMNEETSSAHGHGDHPIASNIMTESDSQEDTKLLLDLNYCPKCNKILTPSQNLLSHIQSHNE